MRRARQVCVAVLMLAVLLLPALTGNASTETAEAEIVKFEGVIQDRPAEGHVGTWTIADHSVEVVEGTIVIEDVGPATVGAHVVLIAKQYEDGALKALMIRVKPEFPISEGNIHLAGYVSEVGEGYFVIHGIRVAMNEQTEFTGGTLQAGVFAAVMAEGTDAGYVAIAVHVAQVDDERLVQIEGILDRIGDSVWVVDGQEIGVTLDTAILGRAQVGMHVEVAARVLEDGTLVADQITVQTTSDWEPEQVEFSGAMESFTPLLLGKWTIAGRAVYVAPRTEIDGIPAVGKVAHVEAIQLPDEKLYARRIVIENSDVEETQFTGTIEHFSRGPNYLGVWIVGGRPVAVLTDTTVEGTPQIGAQATVTGYEGPRGVFVASSIQINGTTIPVENPGALRVVGYITEAGDSYIVVNNLHIAYTDETRVDGALEVGLLAAVRAIVTDSGYSATHIKTFTSVPELPTIPPVLTPEPLVTPQPGETPQGELHMVGYITEVGEGYIVANATRIYYDETTDIQGDLSVGRMVAVRARITPEGTYVAIAITTFEPGSEMPQPGVTPEGTFHLQGVINEAGDGYIIVNSTRVAYNGDTQIEGELQTGYLAQVIAESTPEGYVATSIQAMAAEVQPEGTPVIVEQIGEDVVEEIDEAIEEIEEAIEEIKGIPTIAPAVRPGKLRDLFPPWWR